MHSSKYKPFSSLQLQRRKKKIVEKKDFISQKIQFAKAGDDRFGRLFAFWFLNCRLNCVKSKSPYERAVYTLGCDTARVFYSARSDTPTCRFIQNIAGTLRRRPTAKPYYFDVLDFRTIRLPGTRMNHEYWIKTLENAAKFQFISIYLAYLFFRSHLYYTRWSL